MRHLSVKIPDDLYQKLEQKAKELGQVKMSDALRLLLQDVLGSPDAAKIEQKRYQQLLHYQVTTYHMVQAQLIQTFEQGVALNDKAHKEAQAVLSTLLKKL